MPDINEPRQFYGTNRRKRDKLTRKALEIDQARTQVDITMTSLIPPFHKTASDPTKIKPEKPQIKTASSIEELEKACEEAPPK